MTTYEINTPQEMIDLWEQLSKKHKKILLYADLWAGKTHLVKGFAKWLGIDMDKIHSPTYVYFHEYDDKLLHIDMYRVQDHKHIIRSGMWDKIEDYDHICIEWPRFEEQYVDKDRARADIKIDWDKRVVEVE